MKEIIKSAKDYQLESTIDQFKRFKTETVTTTATAILNNAIREAELELLHRRIPCASINSGQ